MASDKIFVDLDEEITFTVEKILISSSKRVIVVIPESANLVASLISLKLLARQIAGSDRLIVAVTEDKLGLQLSEKAGIIAKEKISDITPKVWVDAEEMKKKFVSLRKNIKDKLISDRTEGSDGSNYKIVDEKDEKEDEDQKGTEDISKQGKTEKSEENDNDFAYAPALAEKPRLEPKVVNLGNIKVLAGGDIEKQPKFLSEIEAKHLSKHDQELKETGSPKEGKKSSDEETHAQEEVAEQNIENVKNIEYVENTSQYEKSKPDIIGRDWSSFLPEETNKKRQRAQTKNQSSSRSKIRTPGIINKVKGLRSNVISFYKQGNTKVKVAITIIIVFALLYILSAFVFSSASVTINISRANVAVSEEVKASSTATTVDFENAIIPVRQIKVDANSSNSGDTSGAAKDGNKAKGLITIYNKEEKKTDLANGTLITNTSTNNVYKLTAAVSVPAAVIDGEGNVNVGVQKDVPMEASSYGEKYNTTGSASYKIAGYTTDQLSAKSFDDITGGDTSDEKAVGQKDIDTLKNGLVEQLKTTLQLEMGQLISEDELLLEESVKYGAVNATSDKKVGETADSLTVSVTLDATGYVVSKSDLRNFVSEAIKNSSDFEGEVNEEDLLDPVIENVAVAGDNITFTIKSEGDIVAGITEDEVAKNIAGKSTSDAEKYLNDLDGVDSYTVSVNPFYVPSFLKKMPSASKIDVNIRTSTK